MPQGQGDKYAHIKVIFPLLAISWDPVLLPYGGKYINKLSSRDFYVNINGETNEHGLVYKRLFQFTE